MAAATRMGLFATWDPVQLEYGVQLPEHSNFRYAWEEAGRAMTPAEVAAQLAHQPLSGFTDVPRRILHKKTGNVSAPRIQALYAWHPGWHKGLDAVGPAATL